MRTITSILLIATFSLSAAAELDLPAEITIRQNFLAQETTCEDNWKQLAEKISPVKQDLGEGSTLFLVPCAQWGPLNVLWTAYVKTAEPTRPGSHITRLIQFIQYNPDEGMIARSTLTNVEFENVKGSKSLWSAHHLNNSTVCGTRAMYEWDAGRGDFNLRILTKQDDCRNPQAPWQMAYRRVGLN